MSRDLSRLFRPASIAVFGGGAWGMNVVRRCLDMGFDGPVWPVHPSRDEVHGLPCYRTVEDLPAPPDAAFIAVNRRLTVEIVQRLAAQGAGGAVCFASGFAEAEGETGDGTALQRALVAAAGEMPVLGPNCYGLINYLDGALLWPDVHGGTRVERGVAVLTQSSNMLINITMQARGLPLAYCIAAGNQAQTGLADMARGLLADDRVTAIGLHIEGVGDIRAFEGLVAAAREAGKPVAALKVGRSEAARAATVSHTASVAGSDAASRAFLARLGIPALESLPAFLEALKLLHVIGPLPGRDIASMSCSGGEASLIADAAEGRALRFRKLTAEERARVKETLGPIVTVANPLDYHTFIWADTEAMTRTYAAMMSAGFDLTFLVLDFPRLDRASDRDWETAVEAIIAAKRQTSARTAVISTLGEAMPEHRVAQFAAEGIAGLAGLDEGLAAAEAAAEIGAAWQRPVPPPLLAAPALSGAPALLDERLAKLSLAAHGVPVPKGRYAATAAEAAAAADALGGPVALKALGIAHKTEHGAVRLNLTGDAAVRDAASTMAAPEGYLVEAMVTGGVAELLVGVVRDPAYGFQLTLGAGGVLTELMQDAASLLIPAPPEAVRQALESLRIWPLLQGYRGKPAGNVVAAVSAVMTVQAFVEAEAARLSELDINPLIITSEGALAADALITMIPRED